MLRAFSCQDPCGVEHPQELDQGGDFDGQTTEQLFEVLAVSEGVGQPQEIV